MNTTLIDDIKLSIVNSLGNTVHIKVENFNVFFSADKKFGHVVCNLTMKNAIYDMGPLESAKKVSEIILNNSKGKIEKIEVLPPGFINIWLNKEYVREYLETSRLSAPALDNTCNKEKNFILTKYSNKKVLVEHTSPSLLKSIHVGHLMNNIIGEFIVRAMRISNANQKNIVTMFFPSDVSIGTAKTINIIKKDGGLEQEIFKTKNENEIVKYLGDCYTRGVKYFNDNTENPQEMAKIKKIANNIFLNIESEDLEIHKVTKDINLLYLKGIIKNLGSTFDDLVLESEAGVLGKKIVLENTGDGKVFKISEGAIIYVPDENRKDINTAVFINSESNPTYEAKDLGLLNIKFKRYNPDYSFFVTDVEQVPHFQVVLDACSKINDVWKSYTERCVHVKHGRMTFKGGKMSSRLGGVPFAHEVLDSVIDEVKEVSSEKLDKRLITKFSNLNNDEKKIKMNEIYYNIALSALKIAILRVKPGNKIDFNPETSLSFEGDSGPYLQYTHARCFSLLEKAKKELEIKKNTSVTSINLSLNDVEIKLMQFNDVLKQVIDELAPQKLVTYLFELAQEFNSFYASNQIINKQDEFVQYRLNIVRNTKDTIHLGLYVLGIQSLDIM